MIPYMRDAMKMLERGDASVRNCYFSHSFISYWPVYTTIGEGYRYGYEAGGRLP